LENALEFCEEIGKIDKDKANLLAFYQSKLHEGLAQIYSDQYFLRTAQKHLDEAELIRNENSSDFDDLSSHKFKLKKANILRK